MKNRCWIAIVFVLFLFWACNTQQSQPKPHGYFRITLPEKSYQDFETEHFIFRYPEYATIFIDPFHNDQKDWFDISFPDLNAKIHMSYHAVHNNFDTLTEDVRAIALKHIPKASGIKYTVVERDEADVYGLIYDISGIGSASPSQFFISDTTMHFLRGSLYFNHTPNNDSIAPVIDFIRSDIDTMIYSLHWK
ncbi:MAG: gliding motility lipoprotein GldD [Bacteroidales bacterium]|jgi:gliding motility-associated lipoprotein GldD|nr:gliding motility lipoprotein GldD [Bacteroidales bacterium]